MIPVILRAVQDIPRRIVASVKTLTDTDLLAQGDIIEVDYYLPNIVPGNNPADRSADILNQVKASKDEFLRRVKWEACWRALDWPYERYTIQGTVTHSHFLVALLIGALSVIILAIFAYFISVECRKVGETIKDVVEDTTDTIRESPGGLLGVLLMPVIALALLVILFKG